jgi:hypothetical protein
VSDFLAYTPSGRRERPSRPHTSASSAFTTDRSANDKDPMVRCSRARAITAERRGDSRRLESGWWCRPAAESEMCSYTRTLGFDGVRQPNMQASVTRLRDLSRSERMQGVCGSKPILYDQTKMLSHLADVSASYPSCRLRFRLYTVCTDNFRCQSRSDTQRYGIPYAQGQEGVARPGGSGLCCRMARTSWCAKLAFRQAARDWYVSFM